ncbi:MAG: lysophospholipid acyltransferase family protein [Fusobacteria bacterium]|nr:lysophospholipid acyltransferase family protein [Fusobacteriota bacterium]
MKNKIKYLTGYYLLLAVAKSIKILPIKFRYKFLHFLGIIAYYTVKKRRDITKKNIKLAFPELSKKEINEISKKSYINITTAFFEVFWLDDLKANIINLESIERGFKKGKGIILISMHYGNWEYGAYKLADIGLKFSGVARKLKNPYVNDYIDKLRSKNGLKIIPKGNGNKQIIRALLKNEILGLISDQYSRDVEVKFFGELTGAVEGPARLAKRYGSTIVTAYAQRINNEQFDFYISDEIIPEDIEDTEEFIKVNTQKMIENMEEIIKKDPTQWMWQHKRWKKTIKY